MDEAPASPPIVCLGASAGGLEALEQFLDALPPGSGAVFVVVVHLSPDFKSLLPELLGKRTRMPVQAVTEPTVPEPEHVYVIPPAQNLVLSGGALTLVEQQRGPGHPINLPIDLFLGALGKEAGDRAIAVLLSGSGSDGSRGLRAVKDAGGSVLVQEPATAKFDGMPRSALTTGLVDHVGTPADLAVRVDHLCRSEPLPEVFAEDDDADPIEPIVDLLRKRAGTELRWYRRAMMVRRIRRRMAIWGVGELGRYLAVLESTPREVTRLRQDLLIGVTEFFRDAATFDTLRAAFVDVLRERQPVDEPLRIWCAACSTGQEAYSLAIVARESMAEVGRTLPVKLFATDVNETALAQASRGVYLQSEIADLPERFASRYFQQHGSDFVVSRDLREMIIFAPHNVVSDPPFTRMDLVSCRNLLIYFDREAQERTLNSLHYALRGDTGLLVLGRAEGVAPLEGRVSAVSERDRIFRRTGPASLPLFTEPARDPARTSPRTTPAPRVRRSTLLEASLESRGTTGALVTPDGRLIELVTDPNGFFQIGKGAPSNAISSLLPVDLVAAFTSAVTQLGAGAPAVSFLVRGFGDHEVELELVDVPSPDRAEEDWLLLQLTRRRVEDSQGTFSLDEAVQERVRQLEQEVHTTRETLQAAIEELQSTNEEQQSTNEELVAANEKLQSTNEELHSVNEELFTVNAEFQRKNQELQVMTNDLDNLLISAELTTLFLDADLHVRRFSPGIERVVRLISHDVGRSIREFTHKLAHDFVEDAVEVMQTGEPITREVRDAKGAWLTMKVRPYRTPANETNGVLVTFVDVTRVKHAEERSRVMSASLQRTNEDLQEHTRQLEDMFSIVAHDLKRPMLQLDGRLVLAREATPDTDEAAPHIDAAIDVLGQVRRMLRDLAVVSSHGRIELQPESVDLQPWFDDLIEPFRVRAEELGVRFQATCDAGTVTFARGTAEVALVNLVDNAFVHGSASASPRVDVSCRLGLGSVQIVVADNGRGIDRKDQGRVFELFRRLHPGESEGTGVGLVSVRRVAERAGGSVYLSSELGKGARFEVTLPLAEAPRPVAALLVDDDQFDIGIVRQAMPTLDLRVASTLRGGRQALVEQPFDLVILDLSLPDGPGIELVPSILELSPTAAVLVLASTTGDVDANHPRLRNLSRVRVLDKHSLDEGELRRTIEACLDREG